MQDRSLTKATNVDQGANSTAKIVLPQDKTKFTEGSSTSILNIPPEVLVKIDSYTMCVQDTTNLLSTNSRLFSHKDKVMPYILKQMESEDAFEAFTKLVISGHVNAVKWFRQVPGLKDPSDADDNNAPFLKRKLRKKDEFGDKIGGALHVAAYYGHRDLVDALLTIGAPVMAKNLYGGTALHIAARKGQKAVVECLLDHGADIGGKNTNGWTALHLAAYWGQEEVVVSLLERGADIEDTNNHGRTAHHIAVRYRHTMIARLCADSEKNLSKNYLKRQLDSSKCVGNSSSSNSTKHSRFQVSNTLI